LMRHSDATAFVGYPAPRTANGLYASKRKHSAMPEPAGLRVHHAADDLTLSPCRR
jgi:hypothetical protein